MFIAQPQVPRNNMDTVISRQQLTGAVDGTLPLAGMPPSLQKYQQLPDLYQKINGVKICHSEISTLFLPEESQTSITADAENRVTGVCALSIIKFVLNLSLKKVALSQHKLAQQDSQINNFRQLCHSTHTNISNQQMALNRQQQQAARQSNSNEDCTMSFETKDAGQKEQIGRGSLGNVNQDNYTDSSNSRRSNVPQAAQAKQPLPSGKSTQGHKEHRDSTNRINQQIPERKHNTTISGSTAPQIHTKSIEKIQKLKTSCRDQFSCPQTPEYSSRNINQKDLYMTPNSDASRLEKPVRHHSRREKQDFTRTCDPELVKLILSSLVDQVYTKASKKLPGWREQTRNIFQTSVCSLTGSKVSSKGNSQIEYIEDFAASNHEASEIQVNGKNQSAFNNAGASVAICPSDEYAHMGKYPNKCDDDEEQEVIETAEKNPYNDTPDLKAAQNQKSSIQTVPSALEEFVHGMEKEKLQSNLIDNFRDSQESKKETLNDSGKVKMFSTKLNPQNKILTQQRRIGRMSPPLPCQSNYRQQEISSRGGRNKTVERHIVDLNQLNNQLGGVAGTTSYHVVGDTIENKPLKAVQFGSGQTYSIYNSQRERSNQSFKSLLSKGSRLKTHSNSAVEVCARDGQQACFPPVVDEEELLNFRNLRCCRQISNECGPATARSLNVHRNYKRDGQTEEEEVVQIESQNQKAEHTQDEFNGGYAMAQDNQDQQNGEDGDENANDTCTGAHDNSTTNPIQSVMLESDDARKEHPMENSNTFPRINLEEENASEDEIASEDEGSEYVREKKRQEETRRMIELAKQNRKKCIDDSSSSSDHNNDMDGDFGQPLQIEEDEQDYFDFEAIEEDDAAFEDKKKDSSKDQLMKQTASSGEIDGLHVQTQQPTITQTDSSSSNKGDTPTPGDNNVHQNYLNADVEDQLQVQPLKGSINLQKIIMENNKNTQRWDLPNFSDNSSNMSDDQKAAFTQMLIVEEEDDGPVIGQDKQNVQNVNPPFDHSENDVLSFEPPNTGDFSPPSDDKIKITVQVNDQENHHQQEVKRTPTPMSQLSSSNDQGQRLEGIKNYLKNDSQFESVPEEIEAENREESDFDSSAQSPPLNFDQQYSNGCTEKSQQDADFDDQLIFDKNSTPNKLNNNTPRGSPTLNLEEISINPIGRTDQNSEDEETDDFAINNVSLEVLTSRIKQRNMELLENSQVSSSYNKPDLDHSYSSCNSGIRKREDAKKPEPLQFDDIDNDDHINPLISFQAEDQSHHGKSEDPNAIIHHEPIPKMKSHREHSKRTLLKDQNGSQLTVFNSSVDMAFEDDQKDSKKSRKSMDFSNNKKIMNSASRLKAPTPSNIDSDDGDGLFLNKSVEIKKRSRNKNSKFLNKNTSSKTTTQKKGLLNLTRKDKDTNNSNSAQQPTQSSANKLFFKPYSSTSGGTSSGRKRYNTSTNNNNQVQPPEIISSSKVPKLNKSNEKYNDNVDKQDNIQQSKNIKDLIHNFSNQRKTLNSPKIINGTQAEASSKKKPDLSPSKQLQQHKTSVVSGLSVISQLSFIKQSFASPITNMDAQNELNTKLEQLQQQQTKEDQKQLKQKSSKDAQQKNSAAEKKPPKVDAYDDVIDGVNNNNIQEDAAHSQQQLQNSQQATKLKFASSSKQLHSQPPLQKKNSLDSASIKKGSGKNGLNLLQYNNSSKIKTSKIKDSALSKNQSQKSFSNDVRNSSLLQQSCNRSENSNDSELQATMTQQNVPSVPQQPQPTQRRSLNNIMGFGQKKKLFK